ncbi:unnamed protein product [Lathyrus sativus]|nr:unnamed protein product [Lathyrus sativus]
MSSSSFKLKCFQCFLMWHVLVATSILSSSTDHSSIDNFLDIAKSPEVFDWMISIRRKIHENPELGYQEF